MRKLVTLGITLILIGTTYMFREEIIIFLTRSFQELSKEVNIKEKNQYHINYDLNYIENVNNIEIKNKQDLINVYYSIINSGYDEFTFICSKNYDNCMNEVLYLAEDETTLSNINSFVHPYNSFTSIGTQYNTLGQVTLNIDKTYDQEKIDIINKEVDRIIAEEIKDEKDTKEIIKIVHDYIINNTKYDRQRADKNIIKYESNTAYGVLIEHYGLCGGYTDAMSLFLNRYNIPNFKVVSENHIWNAVFVNGNWYHLDLTWDDPILVTGEDTLEYTFFLIDTYELEELETNQHFFDKQVFSELG